MKPEIEQWQIVATSALSFIHFVEQNVTDPELALLLDGWIAWSCTNSPCEQNETVQRLENLFKTYNYGAAPQDRLRYARVKRVMVDRKNYSEYTI